MAITQDWNIGGRGKKCAKTERTFEEGEWFYTLLFREKAGFRREDLCEEAFENRDTEPEPFSFWKSKFEPPAPPAPETLPKQSAEELLREFTLEDKPEHKNVRYVLVLMLERKKLVRQVDAKETEDGPLLIYEHVKSGEVFFIPDPELRLDELEPVQEEVSLLLNPDLRKPAPVETAVETPTEPAPAETPNA